MGTAGHTRRQRLAEAMPSQQMTSSPLRAAWRLGCASRLLSMPGSVSHRWVTRSDARVLLCLDSWDIAHVQVRLPDRARVLLLLAAAQGCPAAVASERAALPGCLPACPSEQQACVNGMLDPGVAQGVPHTVARQLTTLAAAYIVSVSVPV